MIVKMRFNLAERRKKSKIELNKQKRNLYQKSLKLNISTKANSQVNYLKLEKQKLCITNIKNYIINAF